MSAFSHRRVRADSTTSFTYYEEENEPGVEQDDPIAESLAAESIGDEYRRQSLSDVGDLEFGDFEDEDSADREYPTSPDDYALHRRSSTHSRSSVHARLLRQDSTATVGSTRLLGRTNQKLYMANEDLTIAIAGFQTTAVGYATYIALCVLSCGLVYLLLRWIPRWRVSLMGRPCALRACDWVIIENQWGEMMIASVKIQSYGRPASTVFGMPDKMSQYGLDDDNDPIINHLRSLDYRYVRMSYHPLKDKFVFSTGWKDPEWTDARLARLGLDSDEKAFREILFGSNLIDIEIKSIGQLLVDEVCLRVPVRC